MKVHLYLSLIPEALVFSMLEPREFGRYISLGSEKRTHGQALFVEVDQTLVGDAFPLEALRARCQPHPDGTPHRSSYVSIYRTIEHIPVAALGRMFLVTRDGTILELEKSTHNTSPSTDAEFHLYQEFGPVSPLVVSRLNAREFGAYITKPGQPVFVPKIVFAELFLGPLGLDPESPAKTLPYRNLAQIRACLKELQARPEKTSKIVDRHIQRDLPFWMIHGGVSVSDASQSAFYPMPTEEELRESNFNWWSSARAVEVL